MKEILGFFKWTWTSWELWQRAIIFSFVLNIGSVFAAAPWAQYMNYLGWSILLTVVVKDLWWPMVRDKWTKYKNHRNELLTTIKGSNE